MKGLGTVYASYAASISLRISLLWPVSIPDMPPFFPRSSVCHTLLHE